MELGQGTIIDGDLTEENIQPDATGTTSATHAYSEPGTYSVVLKITDDEGGVREDTGQVVVKSPKGAIKEIIAIIEDMNLPFGIENSLTSKLNNALSSLDKDNEKAATNKLNAFINEVNALRGKELTNEQADRLINLVQAIIGYLGGSPQAAGAPRIPTLESSALLQNYPNPFNPETWIPFTLKEKAQVVIRIYNLTGQLIKTLDLGEKEPGEYLSKDRAAYWNGHNDSGEEVASGIYFYQLRAGDKVLTKKMVVLK